MFMVQISFALITLVLSFSTLKAQTVQSPETSRLQQKGGLRLERQNNQGQWNSVEDEKEIIALKDFGGDATLHFNERQFDTYVNPLAAFEVQTLLKEIFENELIKSITFTLEYDDNNNNKEQSAFSSSDLLYQIPSSEEETSSRKCSRCGKSFSSQTFTNLHFIREHLIFKFLSQPQENSFVLLDKACKFFDCTKDKELSELQDTQTKQRRLANCMYFMAHNIQEMQSTSSESTEYEWNTQKFMRLCGEITGDDSSLTPKSQSKFVNFMWKVFLVFFILIASSYYSILFLTEEGRRAWLTPLK